MLFRSSWCEADVFEIHGDVFPRTQLFPDWQDDEDLTVVYPDQNPRGEVLRGDGPPEGVIDRNSMMDRRSSGRISPAPRVYYETQDGDSLVPEGAELPPPVVVPQRSPVLEKPKAGLLRMPRTLPAQPASSKSEPERRAIGSGAKTAGGSR